MTDAETYPEADRIDGFPHPRDTVTVFGHDAAAATFVDAWDGGRLHHAWLLRGPKGIGKATLSYRIARSDADSRIGFKIKTGIFKKWKIGERHAYAACQFERESASRLCKLEMKLAA